MNRRIGLLLFLSLLFSSCGAQPSVTSPLASKPTPIPLTLAPCTPNGVKAECGYLRVPEDRTDPNRRILDLGIVIVRARNPNPEPDPLFYLAGGPGVAATDPANVAYSNSIFWGVNAQRDIVFLDQRGTNDKHRLTCEYPSFRIADAPQRQVNSWMKKCLADLDGDPRFYTTAVAMRDLEDARTSLGYNKINLYGISYGVNAAQVYMRMFPEHVRAAVLDHGTALDLPFYYAMPRASQSVLDQIFTYCEQDEKCHAAYPDIRGDWKKILNRLAKGPVVTSYIPPGMDHPIQVDRDSLARGTHSLLMEDNSYAKLPSVVHTLAANEDWTLVVKSLNEQNSSSSQADNRFLFMEKTINCFEPTGRDLNTIARLNSTSYYVDEMIEDVQSDQKLCDALPKPDPSLIYGLSKPTPLSALIINGLLDPQNPPSNMDLALKEFTKSRRLVEPTTSHANTTNSCKWEIIAKYIQQGSVDGLDTSCLEKSKPSFVVGE